MTQDSESIAPMQQEDQDNAASTNQANALAFANLLNAMRAASLSIKDQGDRFEHLAIVYLSKDAEFQDLFLKVQFYKDWALEYSDLAANCRDTGIDLVATNNPIFDNASSTQCNLAHLSPKSQTFTAIQCKFYSKNTKIQKAGIDSFIAASSQDYFTQRYIIATNVEWTDNVLKTINNPHFVTPIKIISL